MKLSIIVPFYNTPISYLGECLQSIRSSGIASQYEVIIVNDGSTSREVLEFLLNHKDPYCKIFHKENGGVSSARNLGKDEAKGEYIIFLDADDILLPEINNAIAFLDGNSNYDLVYSDSQIFGDVNYRETKGSYSKFKLLYIGNFMNTTTLMRREIVNDISFNENLNYAEDWDFWCKIASSGHRYKYLRKPIFNHRKMRDGKSLSQQNFNEREYIKDSIKNQFDTHKEITISEVNEYVLNNFKDNKKQVIKLFVQLFFPSIFKTLVRRKIYKNNIVID